MSGWYLTTDDYYDGNGNGNVDCLMTVHFSHIVEKRPIPVINEDA
jgi:hypothetical protein